MDNKVGKKELAQIIGWLCFVAGIIAGIILLATGEQIGWAVLGSGVVVLFSCWFIYGFGQLVHDVHEIKEKGPASAAVPVSTPATEQRQKVVIEPKKERRIIDGNTNCPKCGAKNEVSRVFCKECGERLS